MKNLLKIFSWSMELRKFFIFLKCPKEGIKEQLSFIQKLKLIISLLTVDSVVAICLVMPLCYLIDGYVVNLKEELYGYGLVELIALAVFVAPLFEEIIFRLPLRYNRNYIFQLFDKFTGNSAKKLWTCYYPFFFFSFALGFGVLHIANYANNEVVFYAIAPFLVVSQIFGGLILGYIRLKINLWWSLLYHAIYNALFVCLALVFFHNVVTISYSDTHIEGFEVKELMYIDKENQRRALTYSNDRLLTIDFENANLQSLIDSLKIGQQLEDDVWVDIKMAAPKGILKEKIIELLKEE